MTVLRRTQVLRNRGQFRNVKKGARGHKGSNYWAERGERELTEAGRAALPLDHPVGMLPPQENHAAIEASDQPRRPTFVEQNDEWTRRYAEKLAQMRREETRARTALQPEHPRSSRSQAVVDWEEKVGSMPLGECEISSRKHSVAQHLMRIRTNAKYRWNHERFVSRREAAISDLAQRDYRPELLLLEAGRPVPQHIDPDRTNIVYADHWVLGTCVGMTNHEGVAAEYFIPEEGRKNLLWLPDSPVTLGRVAVLLDIADPEVLGSILRSAVGLGYDAILLAEGCADPYTDEVLDASLCAHVSAGGYPRMHILREADGDDTWGIVNRVIARHDLLPVAAAAGPASGLIPPDALWGELRSRGQLDRGMCVFFGGREGLDLEYVRHNTDHNVLAVGALAGADPLLFDAAQKAALTMHALREPVGTEQMLPPSAFDTIAMRSHLAELGTGMALEPRYVGRTRVAKSYLGNAFGGAAYKTEVRRDLTVEQRAAQGSAATA
eukprot:TRINITY_DN46987_c0_g1_i1.p1 TRINITY_DN46987_c0_g1~~TRINITY_DN46987_c0_g1_i1.p1  ORF type:complete len:520 (+),score=158.59 TRINITY_DN46987_c0_g1_i1:78-1562(+)